MFFSRRNSRSQSGKQQPRKRNPFRPMLETLEDRITPNGSFAVTSFTDTGAGTLRDAIAAANADTTGGTFTITLPGSSTQQYKLTGNTALTLNNPNTTILIQGQGLATIVGSGSSRVFQVNAGTNAILQNIDIQSGKAQDNGGTNFDRAGGGLLNKGGKVALTNVGITGNSAASPNAGGSAAGGGIFSIGGTLALDRVTLTNNVAAGGDGAAGNNPGGNAFGGALGEINTTVIVTDVAVTAGNPATPLPITFDPSTISPQQPLLTVNNNVSHGGKGGDGIAVTTAKHNGGNGGQAVGGGLWLDGGNINIVAASAEGNSAEAGAGGQGHSGAVKFVGTGGTGGNAFGGALETDTNISTITVQDSTFASNNANGGQGGQGGNGTMTNGQNGGNGGAGVGGAFEVFFAGSKLDMFNSTVADNNANGAAGGQGGTSDTGNAGNGGNGGMAFAGGLDVRTTTTNNTLTNVTIAFNQVDNLANAGNGGAGGGTGGMAGTQGTATGAGINSDGTAVLINSAVAQNMIAGGNTANAGFDVSGKISTNTSNSYFGNPNGGNNLETDNTLFNATNQTPRNSNLYGGFNDATGKTISANPQFIGTQPTDNTGPTPTIEIQSTSPLVGRGNMNVAASALDQRGVSRANSADLGAVEASAPITNLQISGSISPATLTAGSSSTPLTVNITGVTNNGTTVSGGTLTFALINSSNQQVSGITQNPTPAVVGTNGTTTATLNLPSAGLSADTYSIRATYTPAGGTAANPVTVSGATLTVNPVTNNFQITGSVTPSTLTAGSSSTPLTVNITGVTDNGTAVTGGTLTLALINSSNQQVSGVTQNPTLAVVGTNGTTTATLNLPSAGLSADTYSIRATYTPAGGTAAKPVTVSGATLTVKAATPPATDVLFTLQSDNQIFGLKLDSSGHPLGDSFNVQPGTQARAIATTQDAAGNPALFDIDNSNQVDLLKFDSSGNPLGTFAATPALPAGAATLLASHDPSNNPELFALGLDGAMYYLHFDANDNPVGNWTNVQPGALAKNIAVSSDAAGRPELFAVGMDNNVYALKFDASGNPSGGFFNVQPGAQVLALVAGHDGSNNPELFVLGLNSQIYAMNFNGTDSPSGGFFNVQPGAEALGLSVGSNAAGDPVLFAIGNDRNIYALRFNAGGSPSGGFFNLQPGAEATALLAGHDGSNNPELFAEGLESQVYALTFDASGSPSPFFLTQPGTVKALAITR
jgi:hypothetical protein